jgi:hypothetical protein
MGVLLGGIGLAIYFRSVVDFLIPIAIFTALALLFKEPGVLGALAIAGLWGYFRAVNSHERLDNANRVP